MALASRYESCSSEGDGRYPLVVVKLYDLKLTGTGNAHLVNLEIVRPIILDVKLSSILATRDKTNPLIGALPPFLIDLLKLKFQ